MRATIIHGPHDVRVEDVPDPVIEQPTDALVRIERACVCGSDLWSYRGERATPEPRPIGHEFIGVVEEVGSQVEHVAAGRFVIAPFTHSDGTCVNCARGLTSSCDNLGVWGAAGVDGRQLGGAQAEYIRVPFADGTLVPLPQQPEVGDYRDLLALSDVMPTGHHAARCANVTEGGTVVVVGDGAVGLSGVLAAQRLGAGRIITMSRRPDRQTLARRFGATDIVDQRGGEGVAAVCDLLGGRLADSVLECVGTEESMRQSLGVLRPGGHLGFVGVPATDPALHVSAIFPHNFHLAGGMAPARPYIDELLPDVLAGRISPGLVFDRAVPLDKVGDAYEMMTLRKSIKTMVTP
ncbi:alcohol dehydrogenase catalytic domain-containing protein [Tomitella cavernea]|uniref:Zinc-dependent alcohol dehydrogenase family protein n=1 Tax=Tomitella cavernea TaxID=1387982 RepID=A0ABP9CVT5_9ACTN|nr:alcohol dehydrogenase catalytic domain-containing protein [Tomitella cavernea]